MSAGGVTYVVVGLPELFAKLNTTRMIAAPVERFFRDAAAMIRWRAYQHAAKDTGLMSQSLYNLFDSAAPMHFAYVIAPVPYSIYQEMGTYKMKAHPFMLPAFEEKVPEIVGPLLGILAANIERGMAV